jgi:large subunit ribosomal protein L25
MTSDGVETYEVDQRAVLGKKVKRLRRDGVLPANIYGRGIPSVAVQMPLRAAREMLTAHGTNTLIRVQVSGEADSRPVTVRAVKRHPASGAIEHLDFYQVDLQRTMRATVPVTVIGEAPAVNAYGGILIQGMDSVQVEALPSDVPTHLEVAVDGLEEIDDQVTVADLIVPGGVTIHADSDLMLARVTRPRLIVEEEEEVPEGEEALPEGEEGEEGEAPAEAEEQTE